jgi:UDP-N-acetylmuramyl pentapeptide synthase
MAWPLLSRLAAFHRMTLVRPCRVVVVIGSLGKTTTRRAVEAALGLPSSDMGSGNAWSSVALAMLRTGPSGRRIAVEVGIEEVGQMDRYVPVLRPNVVVVTCIGTEHHRSLGTAETTRHEKAQMVRALRPSGLAVLNGDDPNVLWMAGQTAARVLTFGFGRGCDVRASHLTFDWPAGMRFRLHADGHRRDVRVRLFGRQMCYPILAAVGVALAEGIALDAALERLEMLPPTSGRMEPVPLAGGAYLLRDDFKSTYETIVASLDALAQVPARRRIAVLGEVSEPPGPQGPVYREIGAQLAAVADRAIIIGHNYQRYAAGAVRAGMSRKALIDAGTSPWQAVEELRRDLGPGDVVLIKGRDNQRLERVALALEGRDVRCRLVRCRLRFGRCSECSALERGHSYVPFWS